MINSFLIPAYSSTYIAICHLGDPDIGRTTETPSRELTSIRSFRRNPIPDMVGEFHCISHSWSRWNPNSYLANFPFSVGKNVNPHFGWSNPTTWNYPSFALETSFINFPFLMVDYQFRMVHFVKRLVGELPQFSVGTMLFLMRQDSFFEYLLKGYILFKDLELLDIQKCFYWWCCFLKWRFGLKMYTVYRAWRKTWGPAWAWGPKKVAKWSWELGRFELRFGFCGLAVAMFAPTFKWRPR